jgi:hypothetical protein
MHEREKQDPIGVLGYAMPDTDGLPEFVPEAERMISLGADPDAIRYLFRRADYAPTYYAKSQSRRYSFTSAHSGCIGCNKAEPDRLCEAHWLAEVVSEMRASIPGETFRTVHPMCRDCYARNRRIIFRYRCAYRVCTVLLIAITALAAFPLLGYRPGIVDDIQRMFVPILVALGFCFFLRRGVDYRMQQNCSKGLRALMPQSVQLLSIGDLLDRRGEQQPPAGD